MQQLDKTKGKHMAQKREKVGRIWKQKIRKGTPLETALKRFNWSEIDYNKDEKNLEKRKLENLISTLKVKI
jgi:hypothetical protein